MPKEAPAAKKRRGALCAACKQKFVLSQRRSIMEKYTWRAVLKEGKKEEYIRRHDEIWPKMVKTLKEAGICNYTIWLDGNELFGYYECEKGVEFALKYQKESPVVAEWDESMKPIMEMKEAKPVKVFELN